MLTDNQKEALEFQRHISVTANAGAGKTFVLVRRFVDILMKTDTHVNELVAITFTEKAASELRKKIADYIEERIYSNPGSGELIKLERIRDQLISSNIGTIHSFCAQILREYPIEAGVDAAFTVLEGVDQQIAEQDSVHETFEAILNDATEIKRAEELRYLVRTLGRYTVERYLSIFLAKRELVERFLQDGACLDERIEEEKIIQRWDEILISAILERLTDSLFRSSLERVIQTASGKTSNEVKDIYSSWATNLKPDETIRIYAQMANLIFTQKDIPRKEFLGSSPANPQIENDLAVIVECQKNISKPIKSFEIDKVLKGNKILLQSLRVLLDVFRVAISRYDGKKQEYAYLDFEDILIKAKILLCKGEVRDAIAKKFKFIMVDEFQDTNRLQYEILQTLVSNYQSGNLFIVGDPKQSIYGFRDAEVEIFESAKEEILTKANGKGVILAESYRLLPNLIDFVNRLFSKIIVPKGSRYEVRYDELVQGRQSAGEGTVELMMVPVDDNAHNGETTESGNDASNFVQDECRLVGERIIELTRDGFVIYPKKDENPRPIEFKDIAILLRKRTHLATLEKVLTEYRIPFVLTGGMGFYQTQEVLDFLNYFKFLLNPKDDISLVGILRSNFFSISDAELFGVSFTDGESFWDKMIIYSHDKNISANFKRAVKILTKHLGLVNRINIPLLVDEILSSTGWRGTTAGLPFGEQNGANIKKFLRIARDFTARGYTTLYDFVRRLSVLMENEEREGQAPLEITGNCVQVLTIHSAKGLEFPVVFIPFIHQKFRYDNPPIFDSDLGIAFKIRDEANLDEEIVPSILHTFKERSKQKTEAEEKRIFYVACTRARDALFLSCQLSLDAFQSTYLKWLTDALEIEPKTLGDKKIVFPAATLRALERTKETSKIKRISHQLTINVRFWDRIRMSNLPLPAKSTAVVHPNKILISSLAGNSRGEYFSSTQIKTYLECPRKYYLKYVLGVPDINSVPDEFDESEDSDDILKGDVEGKITHAVLEKIHNLSTSEEDIRRSIILRAKENWLLMPADLNRICEVITKNIISFINTPFGIEIFSAQESKNEYSIDAIYHDDYLVGIIDRLYRDADGNWNIVDYKTDKINFDQIKEKAEMYKPQLLFYAFLVNILFQQSMVKASLVFLKLPAHPYHFEFSIQDFDNLRMTLTDSITRIKSGDYHDDINACSNCSYHKQNECLAVN